ENLRWQILWLTLLRRMASYKKEAAMRQNRRPDKFRITCYGQAELPTDDDLICGTIWVRSSMDLGGTDQLTDAMMIAEQCASENGFRQPAGAVSFSPHRVLIRDRRGELAIGCRF